MAQRMCNHEVLVNFHARIYFAPKWGAVRIFYKTGILQTALECHTFLACEQALKVK